MQQCPKCRSENIHRSRARTAWENWRRDITGKRPFRCHGCGWRGWSVDRGPNFSDLEKEIADRALAPDPPNLQDAALIRDDRDLKPIDLDQLDYPRFPRPSSKSLVHDDE
jgi:hypothetical protein